ncbi:MAG: hypothetical protein ACE5R7_07870, partial [Nitrosarchaeum sp.]
MKFFLIFLVLIGFIGIVFASDNQIIHTEHYQPNVELLPDNIVQYGESFTIHAWLPMYDDKPDELQYFVDVLDSDNNQIDSTLWFAKEDFVYEFDTTHVAYNITKSGTYFIKIEKADQLQRTGSFYNTLEFKINFPSDYLSPLKQFKSGIPINQIQCKDSLFLIQKYDGSPACVKPETAPKLMQRGWILPELNPEPTPGPEPSPEPAPMSESETLQKQKQQQAKLHTQEVIMTDYRDPQYHIRAINDYRSEFESGYFLEQFIFSNKQNYEKDDLINFIFVEWGYQPQKCTSPKVEVYLRPYDNYDKIEKISEWQKP